MYTHPKCCVVGAYPTGPRTRAMHNMKKKNQESLGCEGEAKHIIKFKFQYGVWWAKAKELWPQHVHDLGHTHFKKNTRFETKFTRPSFQTTFDLDMCLTLRALVSRLPIHLSSS